MPLIERADRGNGQNRDPEEWESEHIPIQRDQDMVLGFEERNDGPHVKKHDSIMGTREIDEAPIKDEHLKNVMDLDGGDVQILSHHPDPSEMFTGVTQIAQGPETDEPETLISAFSELRLTAEGDQDTTTDEYNMPSVTNTAGAKPTNFRGNPHHPRKKGDNAPGKDELPQQAMDWDSEILPEDPSGRGGDRCLKAEVKKGNECEARIALNLADTVTGPGQLTVIEESRQDVLDTWTTKENDTDSLDLSTTGGETRTTGGTQTDMDTDGDKTTNEVENKGTELTTVARQTTGPISDGQWAQPPPPPAETAAAIKERNHVSKTLALLSPPSYDKHTIIVSAFDTCITKADFGRLQPDVMITDEVVNWMMRWWTTQVNGRFGKNPTPPPSNPRMPRCYFASTL
jgi:hypothetical protein